MRSVELLEAFAVFESVFGKNQRLIVRRKQVDFERISFAPNDPRPRPAPIIVVIAGVRACYFTESMA